MIHVVDNFLDLSLFEKLREEMILRVPWHNHYEKRVRKNQPIRLGGHALKTKNIDELLGVSAKPIINIIKSYILVKLNFINPLENWVWYQYTLLKEERVKQHYDGIILDRLPKQCFTSFIYTHNQWEDDWGGELCFKTEMVLPKPNRFVIYSRDHLHWVNTITHNKTNFQRMSIGVDWSTDNDF